jgi:DNA polymerase-3 subunit epsilon
MRICIIDTETTGLNPADNELIEVAFAVFNFTETDFSLIECASFLLPCDSNEAFDCNGIAPELTQMSVMGLSKKMKESIDSCDCFIAHNAAFDKSFFNATFECKALPWVCTVADYELDCGKSRKLTHVCADNGIFFTAGKHRAMIDVLMLAELVGKLGYERFVSALERSKMPEYRLISLAPFSQKEEVKSAGFRWNPDSKQWTKNVKTKDVDALVRELSFRCVSEALI